MKAFRSTTHVDYSEHVKVNARDIANFRTAFEYLSTGNLPPKMGIGEMYSDAMRFSVLRAYAGGGSCTSANPFGTDNATLDLICPGCLAQSKVSVLTLDGGYAFPYAPVMPTISGGTAGTESTNFYVAKLIE